MMKRILAFLLCALLLCSSAAAESSFSDCAIANGTVQAVSFADVTAPYSGVLGSFDLAMGDSVTAGDQLFTMLTTTFYATEDGVIRGLFGAPGDDASALTARYGAVAALEPTQQLRIQASIVGAYDDEENRTIRPGETLYFRSSKGEKEEGYGRVISVSGRNYVVDVLDGEFEQGESLTLYRDDRYGKKDNVGKGSVIRRDPVLIQAQGRIAAMLVKEGDRVKAGAPLFTIMGYDADTDASPAISSPADGVVGSVAVAAGQQVWKGQLLARIYLTNQLEVVAEVDEIDLNGLRVGDRLSLTLDADADAVVTGTVTEISALGVTRQNAAYYTVHVCIPADTAMLGASASVYIPRD